MLDLDEIKRIFKEQILYQRTWSLSETSDSMIEIKTVKLGLMRIKMKDTDTYVLLPVWDFIGKWSQTDENGRTTTSAEDVSFLTINAIDGSVVDRYLGY